MKGKLPPGTYVGAVCPEGLQGTLDDSNIS